MMSLNLKTFQDTNVVKNSNAKKNCIPFIEDYKVSDIVDSALLLTYKYYYLYVQHNTQYTGYLKYTVEC